MQETHSISTDTKIWNTEWGSKAYYAHGRSNSRGVAVLFKRGFNPKVNNILRDSEGRYLLLQITIEGEIFTLLNIYAPTQNEGIEQIHFIENLDSVLDNFEISNLFMGGDFNTQMCSPQKEVSRDDNTGGDNSRPQSQRAIYISRIEALLNHYDIADTWAHKFPNQNRSTFHRGKQSSTLDYWFLPNHLLDSVSSFTISPHPLSDHSLLLLSVGVSPHERGPGYWRFNNQLLEDSNFV